MVIEINIEVHDVGHDMETIIVQIVTMEQTRDVVVEKDGKVGVWMCLY